MKMD
ncbi:Protein of unknown function [Bacillus cytotoxicus]|jgi:hypothetical protein